ncbi:MAG: gamma-glutamyltranspeptidase [Paenibacillus sp.]|jgi:gamma-glutamyltranspeptidase/glutathione hydrolase|nr:gamma-glutamyltranspeptidase [Paenibacillus sp.]
MTKGFRKKIALITLIFTLCFSSIAAAAQSTGRPTTMGTNGMVTTQHYLASAAALKVLQDGGNAVDAAIAAAAVLSVVYPHYVSIGGDAFWMVYNAETKELKALNASGRSGENVTIDFYKNLGYSQIPSRGYLSANTVPGAVSGWEEAYKYAKTSMKNSLPWDRLLEPAIQYAGKGFPVTPNQELWTIIDTDTTQPEIKNLQRFETFRNTFLKPNGDVYKAGDLFVQKDLAHTLEQIAKKGADGFYKGEVAEKIVADIQKHGGVMTKKDYADHKANWVDPISANYRGYTAYNFPPNTQGMASLSILNILNNFDLKNDVEEGSADYYHLIVEATKHAFADRDKWLTDPEFADIPVDEILSKERGIELASRIDMTQVSNNLKPLDPKGDTVWLGIVDKDGNAVSMIQSHYFDYGSGVVADGTGVLLQNRGSFFSLDPDHINRLEPNKRTFHTLNPAMLFKHGKPYLVYGTQGGEGQPQTQTSLVTRIIDYGFTVQQAIEAPRWLYGRTVGAQSNDVKVEGRIPKEVQDELIRRGHSIVELEAYTDIMGQSGAILIHPDTNVKFGGADPRGEGAALGY